MTIAAMWGKAVGYEPYDNQVIIETIDGRVIVIKPTTFDYLYYRLDDYTAALKEDCIEYVVNDSDRDLFDYPEWYIDAVADGLIYESCCTLMFYTESGEIAMSPNSMILRNFMGDLMYMEPDTFRKYYDTLED